MNKQFWVIFSLSATMMAASTTALADAALTSAFQRLNGSVSSTDAGAYESQVRNVYTGGSGSLRFPPQSRTTVLGLTFTPPDVHVGCNGIDWHLGGISWVKSQKIKQMIQSLLPAATMYVIKLAINALCEDCADEIGKVLNAVRQATQAAMNSCQLASQVANSVFGSTEEDNTTCQNAMAESGVSDSRDSDRNDLCKDGKSLITLADKGWFQTMSKGLDDFNAKCGAGSSVYDCVASLAGGEKATGETRKQTANKAQLGIGNWTWNVLKQRGLVMDIEDIKAMHAQSLPSEQFESQYNMSIAMGELLMSLVGTKIKSPVSEGQAVPVPPTIQQSAAADIVSGIILCGGNYFQDAYTDADGNTLTPEIQEQVRKTCRGIFGEADTDTSTVFIRTCSPNDPGVSATEGNKYVMYQECYNTKVGSTSSTAADDLVGRVPLSAWLKRDYVKDTIAQGTLGMSLAMMDGIVKKITDSGPLSPGVPFDNAELAFIGAAPFPMYKVLNHAAIFPGLRSSIYKTYGNLIALMMADEFIGSYVRGASQFANGAGSDNAVKAPTMEVMDNLAKKLDEVNGKLDGQVEKIGKNMQRASLIRASIMQTEQQMRNTVFSRAMLGNQGFISDLAPPASGP